MFGGCGTFIKEVRKVGEQRRVAGSHRQALQDANCVGGAEDGTRRVSSHNGSLLILAGSNQLLELLRVESLGHEIEKVISMRWMRTSAPGRFPREANEMASATSFMVEVM